MDSEHLHLLYYTNVRWLSKGNVVARVFELRKELQMFLNLQGKSEFASHFTEEIFVHRLAYLVDIFDQLNRLNLKLQGKERTIIDFVDNLLGFIEKLENWKRKAEKGNFAMFDSLSTEASDVRNPDVASEVVIHLVCLHKEFLQYFPEISRDSLALVKNPFLVSLDEIDENLQDELIVIGLRNDSGCKDVFYHSSVTEFWAKMSSSYPNVAKV